MKHPPFRRKVNFTKRMMDLPAPVKLISFIMFIYYLGWAIADPFLSIYFKDILGTFTRLGIVYAIFPLFSIFWVLLAGLIIDRNSKKKLINISLFLYTPLSSIILNISSMFSFVLFRLYHSIIASSLWLSVESYLREHSPKRMTNEARGLFDSVYGSALVIGPIIGAFVFVYIGYSIFYMISLFAIFAFILSLMLKDNKHKINVTQVSYTNFKLELKTFWDNISLRRVSIFYSLVLFCMSFVAMLLPLFLLGFGASYFQIGIVYALYYSPILFEAYFSTLRNKKWVLFGGLLGACIVSLLMFKIENLYYLFGLSFLLGLSISCIVPIIQGRITRLMPKNQIGELSAVLTSLTNLSQATGLLVAGVLADAFGINSMFLVSFLVFVIILIISSYTKYVEFENA